MHQPRNKKLIRPRLQLTLIGCFCGVAALAMLLEYLLVGSYLTEFANTLPDGGATFLHEVNGVLLRALTASILFLLPVVLLVGIPITFRIAGPVYRFEKHLGSIARGEEVGECRIRKGDQLQELCGAINAAVATLRQRTHNPLPRPESAPAEAERAPRKIAV